MSFSRASLYVGVKGTVDGSVLVLGVAETGPMLCSSSINLIVRKMARELGVAARHFDRAQSSELAEDGFRIIKELRLEQFDHLTNAAAIRSSWTAIDPLFGRLRTVPRPGSTSMGKPPKRHRGRPTNRTSLLRALRAEHA